MKYFRSKSPIIKKAKSLLDSYEKLKATVNSLQYVVAGEPEKSPVTINVTKSQAQYYIDSFLEEMHNIKKTFKAYVQSLRRREAKKLRNNLKIAW